MEQGIRFCTSADGTRIAYATYGEPAARALVWPLNFETPQEPMWKYPRGRALFEGVASGRRFVTFDARGVGSSQREADDLSIAAQVADLAAVVGQLGLDDFDLMGAAKWRTTDRCLRRRASGVGWPVGAFPTSCAHFGFAELGADHKSGPGSLVDGEKRHRRRGLSDRANGPAALVLQHAARFGHSRGGRPTLGGHRRI